MRRTLSLIFFLVLVVGGGTLIGTLNIPGEWYASLQKPWFNPPNWIFGPVWTVLYILIAIAGWRTWRRDAGGHAMRLWWLQLVLNFAWNPTFFGLQRPSVALVIVVALLAAVLAFKAATWRTDRLSSVLFLPYAAWVGFATALNATIVWLN